MSLERKLEEKLRRKVKELGGLCIKWVAPGTTGVPDRIVFMPEGRIYFVEMKAPGKKMEPRQKFVGKILARFGFEVLEINSEEKLTNFLNFLNAAA